jgi:small subunit ribosomal protein S19
MGKRSIWKGPFIAPYVLKKAQDAKAQLKHAPIKIWSRGSTIIPDFIGLTFSVHNGKQFIAVSITDKMIGKKFGEFAPTRIFKGHGANRKATK